MFVLLRIGNRNSVIARVNHHQNEDVYLFKADAETFPLLSQLDPSDPSCFNGEDAEQLLKELALANSEAEIELVWAWEEAGVRDRIAGLERDLKRYSHSMWSIGATKLRDSLVDLLEQLQRRSLSGQSVEDVSTHIDALIGMAERCQHDSSLTIDHDPLA